MNMHPRYIIRTEEDLQVARLRHANHPSFARLRKIGVLEKRLASWMGKTDQQALADYRAKHAKVHGLESGKEASNV